MRGFVAAILISVPLISCGSAEQPSAVPEEIQSPQPPPAPLPNYSERDGSNYYYAAALSEDDKKAGKAAGSVVVFRYRGEKDGVFKLESEGVTFRCKNPCSIIRGVDKYGNEQNMQYVPESIIGSAFDDAFNGFMATGSAGSK